jgi:hypothetical protein
MLVTQKNSWYFCLRLLYKKNLHDNIPKLYMVKFYLGDHQDQNLSHNTFQYLYIQFDTETNKKIKYKEIIKPQYQCTKTTIDNVASKKNMHFHILSKDSLDRMFSKQVYSKNDTIHHVRYKLYLNNISI